MATTVCDYLIIGGGSAGCILARRLAERTAGRIILVEAGKSDEGDDAATDLSRLDEQTADYDWGFTAATLPGHEPQLAYARARMLGGCGNHNDCAFLIPPDSDFEAWQALGASGWGPAAVAPYFARIEERVSVDQFRVRHPVSEAFVAAGQQLGMPLRSFRERIDEGVGWFPLNAAGRLRHSSSVAYLHPLVSLPRHLEVWTETFAERLLFEGRRVIGATTSRGRIEARRGVILTAGAIQTPQLMMLSGLGPAAQLRLHGIDVVADLPGVGAHLLDHVAAAVVWDLRDPVAPWELTPFQATMMMRIDADAPAPDVLFHFGLRVREKYGDHPRFAGANNGVKASPNVTRARSEGRIRLASPDPRDQPRIELDYFSDPEGYDERILRSALRFTRRLADTEAFGRLVRAEIAPGPDVVTDADLTAYMKHVCETVYHPSGTAAMGDPARSTTVVDPSLRVKGADGLWVADASVFPAMVTVNINNTVMMIAEKAADLILGRD